MTHVDDFVAGYAGTEIPEMGDIDYARWMLMHFRLPAVMQHSFFKFISGKKLFCTYENKRYRCTGASRLGDVWLAEDFNRDLGYDKRVDVILCSAWSDKP